MNITPQPVVYHSKSLFPVRRLCMISHQQDFKIIQSTMLQTVMQDHEMQNKHDKGMI